MLNQSDPSLPCVPGPAEAMQVGREKGGETFLIIHTCLTRSSYRQPGGT